MPESIHRKEGSNDCCSPNPSIALDGDIRAKSLSLVPHARPEGSSRRGLMPDQASLQNTEEHWKQLCEQAATEHDPHKLLELTGQINALLLQKLPAPVAESDHSSP